MKLFTSKPVTKKVETTLGPVWIKPLLVKHAKMFDSITSDNGNAAEQHTMLAMLLKELLCDKDGNPFEDLVEMSPDEIKETLTVQDFATIVQAMAPDLGAAAAKN